MNKLIPEIEKIYTNRNGERYFCECVDANGTAVMRRISDGWTLLAHGICQYEDGTIEWDYSTGGRWVH